MRHRISYGLLLILTGLHAPVLYAGAKTTVAVKFSLTEPDYRAEYTVEEVKTLETNLSSTLATLLNQHVGFLDFVTDARARYSLSLELGRRDAHATGPYWEVGFIVKMTGPGIRPPQDPYWVMFRPAERYGEPRGTARDLERTVKLKLEEVQDLSYENLVRDFLHQVPICHQGVMLWTDPLGWVLPYRQEDLLMDWGSRLRVVNALQSGAGPIPYGFPAEAKMSFERPDQEDYYQRVFCLLVGEPPDLDKLTTARREDVEVREVYVVVYHYYDLSLEGSESPMSAFASGGFEP